MLTELITKRFYKHHSHVRAYLDALEEIRLELMLSEEPERVLDERKQMLEAFLLFMEEAEEQHEREEEAVLIPVLEQRWQSGDEEVPPEASPGTIREEHTRGMALIRSLKERYLELLSETDRDYTQLLSMLQDVIAHFRRHVAKENAALLSAAHRLVPEEAEEFWSVHHRPGEKKGE